MYENDAQTFDLPLCWFKHIRALKFFKILLKPMAKWNIIIMIIRFLNKQNIILLKIRILNEQKTKYNNWKWWKILCLKNNFEKSYLFHYQKKVKTKNL